jgi:hypothetical protein
MIVYSMAKLDGLETVLDFLKGLQPKIAAQIAKKVMSLNVEPLPADSKRMFEKSQLIQPWRLEIAAIQAKPTYVGFKTLISR